MEKLEIEMYIGSKELIAKFNDLPYEIKLQLHNIEIEWILARTVEERDIIKEIAQDLLEENGFNRKDWNNYNLGIARKCKQASEQTQD